jgi:hypothetical protein
MADQKLLQKSQQENQQEIKRLQQELRRKEKALAEAAALLIASKKIQAYSGEDEGDHLSRGSTQGLGHPRYRHRSRCTGLQAGCAAGRGVDDPAALLASVRG